MIDKNTLEIRQDKDKTVYKSLEEIGEDLPDHSPRFVLLSYPLTLVGCVLKCEVQAGADSHCSRLDECRYHMYCSTTYQ
jgi:hypothetical protein